MSGLGPTAIHVMLLLTCRETCYVFSRHLRTNVRLELTTNRLHHVELLHLESSVFYAPEACAISENSVGHRGMPLRSPE